jgi:hypothetical protein
MDRLGGLAGADYGQKCGGLVPSVDPYRPVSWADVRQIVVGRVRILLLYTYIGLFPGDCVVRGGPGATFRHSQWKILIFHIAHETSCTNPNEVTELMSNILGNIGLPRVERRGSMRDLRHVKGGTLASRRAVPFDTFRSLFTRWRAAFTYP